MAFLESFIASGLPVIMYSKATAWFFRTLCLGETASICCNRSRTLSAAAWLAEYPKALLVVGSPVAVGQSISRLWWRATPQTDAADLCFFTRMMQSLTFPCSSFRVAENIVFSDYWGGGLKPVSRNRYSLRDITSYIPLSPSREALRGRPPARA